MSSTTEFALAASVAMLIVVATVWVVCRLCGYGCSHSSVIADERNHVMVTHGDDGDVRIYVNGAFQTGGGDEV